MLQNLYVLFRLFPFLISLFQSEAAWRGDRANDELM